MLIIHNELCHRAGFSIQWSATTKADYLVALSKEIESPGKGILDNYLSEFITSPEKRSETATLFHGLKGLDGRADEHSVVEEYSEEHVMQKYEAFKMKRNRS